MTVGIHSIPDFSRHAVQGRKALTISRHGFADPTARGTLPIGQSRLIGRTPLFSFDILPGLKSEDSWEAPQAGRQLSWPRPFPSRLHRCCHGGQVSGPSRLRSLAVTVPGGGPGRLSCRQTANRSRDVCGAHGVRVLCMAASDALEADPLTAGLVNDAARWTGPARVRGDYPFDFDACEVSLVDNELRGSCRLRERCTSPRSCG